MTTTESRTTGSCVLIWASFTDRAWYLRADSGAGGPNPPASTADEKSRRAPRRWSIGFRVRTLPVRSFSVMDNGHTMNTTTVSKTIYDSNYNTTSKSFLLGGGLAFEVPLSRANRC